MKHGKRLTRNQKIFLVSQKLNPHHWLYIKNTTKFVEFVNIISGETQSYDKEEYKIVS